MEESSGILSKVTHEIRGSRGGLYFIIVGVVVIMYGCMGTALVGGLSQDLSPNTPLYVFTNLLALVTLLLLCGGVILIVGGGVYTLTRYLNNRAVTADVQTAPTSSSQSTPATNLPQQSNSSQSVQPSYAPLSSSELTLEQRREILQREVIMFVQLGYRVISQTDTSAQLVRPRRPSCLGYLLMALLLIGKLFFTALMVSRRYETEQVYISVDVKGRVSVVR